jgi:hypothetical protein
MLGHRLLQTRYKVQRMNLVLRRLDLNIDQYPVLGLKFYVVTPDIIEMSDENSYCWYSTDEVYPLVLRMIEDLNGRRSANLIWRHLTSAEIPDHLQGESVS